MKVSISKEEMIKSFNYDVNEDSDDDKSTDKASKEKIIPFVFSKEKEVIALYNLALKTEKATKISSAKEIESICDKAVVEFLHNKHEFYDSFKSAMRAKYLKDTYKAIRYKQFSSDSDYFSFFRNLDSIHNDSNEVEDEAAMLNHFTARLLVYVATTHKAVSSNCVSFMFKHLTACDANLHVISSVLLAMLDFNKNDSMTMQAVYAICLSLEEHVKALTINDYTVGSKSALATAMLMRECFYFFKTNEKQVEVKTGRRLMSGSANYLLLLKNTHLMLSASNHVKDNKNAFEFLYSKEEEVELVSGELLALSNTDFNEIKKRARESVDKYKTLFEKVNKKVAVTDLKVFDVLDEEFPWMKKVNDHLRKQAYFKLHSSDPTFSFRPILMVGPPGVGKSRYMFRLSELTGIPNATVMAAGSGGGLMLKGVDKGYSTADACLALNLIAQTQIANPIIMIDELDKSGQAFERSTDIGAILLQFLEKATAKRYFDICLHDYFDISNVSYIATANSIKDMPEALKSRFEIVLIEEPAKEHMLKIALKMHEIYADDLKIDTRFVKPLDQLEAEVVVENVSSIRELAKVCQNMLEDKFLKAGFNA